MIMESENQIFEVGFDDEVSFDFKIESNDQTFDTGFGETIDYNLVSNKPKINNVELQGSKISSDFGLQDSMSAINLSEIDDILFGTGG